VAGLVVAGNIVIIKAGSGELRAVASLEPLCSGSERPVTLYLPSDECGRGTYTLSVASGKKKTTTEAIKRANGLCRRQ